MSDAPKRFKDRSEYSMDEEFATVQAANRGEDEPQFESAEYRQHRADVLREGGLVDEAAELEAEKAEGKPLEEMSPGEHFDRIRGGQEGRF